MSVALLEFALGWDEPAVGVAGALTAAVAQSSVPDRDVPITRFGDVAFEILWPDGELSMPDWAFAGFATTRHVPGGNRNVTQTLGKGPQTITYRLWLDTRADLLDLKERVQETDTLTLFAQMTSAPDAYVDRHGEGYVEIADVLLMGLGTPAIYPDGTVEVDATFQRPSP